MELLGLRDIQAYDGGIGKYADTTISNFSTSNMEMAEKILPSSLLKFIGKNAFEIEENDESYQYKNKIEEGLYESMFSFVDSKFYTPMYVLGGTETLCDESYHEVSLFYAGSFVGTVEVYLYHGDVDRLQIMDEDELSFRMSKNIWFAFDNETADLNHVFNENNLFKMQKNYLGTDKFNFCYIHKIKMNERYLKMNFQEGLLRYVDKVITKEKYPILIQGYCSYFPNSGEFSPNEDPSEEYQDVLIENTKKYYDDNPLYLLEDCGMSVFVVNLQNV